MSEEDAADLGRRLRERDRTAAAPALNLIEDRSPAGRERVARLLREVSPAALGGEAPAHVVGVTGPPGAGKSTLLGELVRAWRADRRTVADTVAVIVQPGSGEVLQFLKSGIMEIPGVLVVTKADLGDVALRARRDLH